MKNSFILYADQEEIVKKLPNEQAGILFKTIFEYVRTGEVPNLDLVVDVAFASFKTSLDANKKKYEETCKARATAGSKGGKQKVANASKSKQKVAKGSKQKQNVANVADTDTDTDIDTDIDIDIDIERKDKGKENFSSSILKIYSEECTNLPQVKVINDNRKRAIDKFKKTFTLEQFREICKKANASQFLIGINNIGWKADIDFLLRIDKATGILEGRYSNKEKPPNEQEKKDDHWEEFMRKMQEEGVT